MTGELSPPHLTWSYFRVSLVLRTDRFGPSKNPLSTLQHGFARISTWRTVDKGDGRLTLELTESDVDPSLLAGFSGFVVRYSVEIVDMSSIKLALVVRNTGKQPLPPFTTALHSYFRVASSEVAVNFSAKDVVYVDQLRGSERLINADGVFSTFGTEEIDLVCINVPSRINIIDKTSFKSSTKITLESDGLPDAVLWNPYINKAASMSDFGDDEWQDMICVESAAIDDPIVVGPESDWQCSVTIRISG